MRRLLRILFGVDIGPDFKRPYRDPERQYLLDYAAGLMLLPDGRLVHFSDLTDNPWPPPKLKGERKAELESIGS